MTEYGVTTIDPEAIREAARRLLADSVNRRAGWCRETRNVSGLMSSMVEQGWTVLTACADLGGLGQGFISLAPIYEELGRALAPASIAGTMALIDVLPANGEPAGLLNDLLSGQARAAAAFGCGDSWTLVEGASNATTFLLISGDDAAIISAACGLVTPIDTWDRSRAFGDLHLVDDRRVPLPAGSARRARAHLDLALAGDSVGAGAQALDEAVVYMNTRQQFGRPIGSYQALKHRAADLKVDLEVARALTAAAGSAYAMRTPGWAELCGQARIIAIEAFRAIAEDSVQFHGGIGFTWEHDCHLFLKRALMNEVLGETLAQTRDRIAAGVFVQALSAA